MEHPIFPFLARHFIPFIFGSLLVCSFSPPASAQDRFAIPGVDDSPSAAPASVAPVGDSPAPVIYRNFLHKLIVLGGWSMWPLMALSVIVTGLSVYLLIDLTPRNFFPEKTIKALREDMDHADLHAAKDRAQKSATCLGQVIYGAADYIADRGYQVLDDSSLFDTMSDASVEFNRDRASVINWISVIAQSAPMIGLLGTVSGMIKAFDNLGNTGMGDPAALAANISEALWTTAAGLVIAVPSLTLYYYFRGRLSKLVARTDRHALRLLNALRRSVVSRSAAAGAHGTAQAPAHPHVHPEFS